MERADVVSLLKRIMASCASFYSAEALTISKDQETQSWILSVNWTPVPSENECLAKTLKEHGFEVVTLKGRTIFRAKQKP